VGLAVDYLPVALLPGVLFPWPSSIRQERVCGDEDKESWPSRGHLSRPIPVRAHAGIYCLLQGCRQVLSQPSCRQGSPTRSAALCGARMLVQVALTRWGTIQAMCQTLLELEQHLRVIVIARDFVQGTFAQKSERSKIKEIMTDDAFMNNLRKALAILTPINALNPIRCPFPRWFLISTTCPKSTRRSCPATLSRARSLSTWLSWHNDVSSSCTVLFTVCRISSTHDTLETGCLWIHKAA